MSLARFHVPYAGTPAEGQLLRLNEEQSRHLMVLRMLPGAVLGLLRPSPWARPHGADGGQEAS